MLLFQKRALRIMRANIGVLRVFLLLFVMWASRGSGYGQAYSPIEIGAHAASVTLSDAVSGTEEKVGFGLNVTYNVSRSFSWDAEGDFFPVASPTGTQHGGRAFLAMVGPKAGWRWHGIGLFVKARPGVANFANTVRVKTSVQNGKPFEIVFPGGHLTHLTLDLGGTMEINTSRRTFVRIDVSEMLLRYDDRVYHFPGFPGITTTAPGVIGNSLFVTAGLSHRFGTTGDRPISVQGSSRWEIGGQFGVLSLGRAKTVNDPVFEPLFLGDDKGFGGRLTYNFNRWLAMDNVINYFYTTSRYVDAQRGGKILQGAFGPKAGFRTQHYGVFAKVLPGFLSYGSVNDNFFPPFPKSRLTHFAVDFGAVLEYYPSRRTMLRFDFGHTAVFYRATAVVAPQKFPFQGNFVDRGFRDNGMEFTTGFGWRF